MRILAIETSCDETAISLVETTGDFPDTHYNVLGNALYSQAATHAPYGGVFPALAKREHSKNLVPILQSTLEEAELLETGSTDISPEQSTAISHLLEREPELETQLMAFLEEYRFPDIDLIAVTNGPGLEPALWVGINFAKAIAQVVSVPVIPVNHMEGHILASIFDAVDDNVLAPVTFPALSLLISGGHTELILMKDWTKLEKIGHTRDDAVGEAFDKVARLLDLPYPGGPEIEKRAKQAHKDNLPAFKEDLPRPMLHSADLDFSFSGLKTAVRYAVENQQLSENDRNALARDFSEAVKDVLLAKTSKAIDQYGIDTLIIGGGVSASQFLRDAFTYHFATTHPELTIYFPKRELSTDNSIMIALSGHLHAAEGRTAESITRIKADGNLSLT